MANYDSMAARDAQKRDVAVQAERHWWVAKLKNLPMFHNAYSGKDIVYVDDVLAIIEERTR